MVETIKPRESDTIGVINHSYGNFITADWCNKI